MGYYQGGRRFALGGKGWTLVLGTTVSLSYIRFRARMFDEDNSQAHHKLKGRHGEDVSFHDQPKEIAGEKEDIVLRVWRQLPEIPLPNLYAVGGVLTALWAYRMAGTFNRLMVVRYSDINYQLRRPDVLANKVVALKYLALPLAVVPTGALLCIAWSAYHSPAGAAEGGGSPLEALRRQARQLKASLAEPYREVGHLARDAYGPLGDELGGSSLAIFAQRSQTVGREVMPAPWLGDVVSVASLPAQIGQAPGGTPPPTVR